MNKVKYNTWIRKKKIVGFSLISLSLTFIAFTEVNLYLRLAAAVLSIPFIYIAGILSYTYYQFAAIGGNYQTKIHDLLVSNIRIGSGKLVDIGTGSAALTIKAAKAFPGLTLTGIDFWGSEWEYSKRLCEANAQIEGVADRIEFIKGSASKLPFEDNEFDVLISCLTFHEVRDEDDKIRVIEEAFRVLKKGGEFIFLDLFLDKAVFGEYTQFIDSIRNLGISEVEAIRLDNMIELPKPLLSRRSLGYGVVMKGKK